MRIYSHCRFVVDNRQYHICRLTTYAGDGEKAVDIIGHVPVVLVYKPFGHAYKRLGLVVGIGARLYKFENLLGRSCGKVGRGRKSCEQWRVMIFTRLSVHCAESITATNN